MTKLLVVRAKVSVTTGKRVFALALAPLHFFEIRTYTVGNIRIPKTQDFSLCSVTTGKRVLRSR